MQRPLTELDSVSLPPRQDQQHISRPIEKGGIDPLPNLAQHSLQHAELRATHRKAERSQSAGTSKPTLKPIRSRGRGITLLDKLITGLARLLERLRDRLLSPKRQLPSLVSRVMGTLARSPKTIDPPRTSSTDQARQKSGPTVRGA